MKDDLPNCAGCSFKMSERICKKEDGKAPPYCPTQNRQELFEQCLKEYEKPEILEFAEAPCTVLAVKDRLLGHNPLAAIYNIDSYYRSLK